MGVRTGLLFIVVVLIAALAALNWGVLLTPTVMSIGLMQITAPLGLIMLGLTALMGVVFTVYVVYLQSSVLLESRRHTKEMQLQRGLADKAEASRFTELRSFLEAHENARTTRSAERHVAVLARIEQMENVVRLRSDQSDATIAVHMGKLDDRLARRGETPSATGF